MSQKLNKDSAKLKLNIRMDGWTSTGETEAGWEKEDLNQKNNHNGGKISVRTRQKVEKEIHQGPDVWTHV